MDLLEGKLILDKRNELVLADVALKKKTLILYYFTTWDCDTCRAFDDKLHKVYSQALSRRLEIAIIVVSVEQKEDDFLNSKKMYYSEWFAIPFKDELNHILVYNYGITHIPSLVVVRKNGTLVTLTGKEDIESLDINVLVTWSE